MARTKSVKVEEKTTEVVEQNVADETVAAEETETPAEETTNAEINSTDETNGEVVGMQCVEGGEPEVIRETKSEETKSEETKPEEEEEKPEEEGGEKSEEEEEEEEEEETEKANVASGVSTVIVNDPIQGNHTIYQPQVGTNNFESTQGARVETARRGEIIKRGF